MGGPLASGPLANDLQDIPDVRGPDLTFFGPGSCNAEGHELESNCTNQPIAEGPDLRAPFMR